MGEALTQKKIRYDWLDVIKALAMLLVILGHLALSGVRWYQAYASFIKLPLFFAASGFVFNPKKTDDVKAFIKGRATRILLPYFYLCFIICICNYFLEGKTFSVWLKASLYSVFTGSIYMWFLPVLFLCNVLMLFVFKAFKNKTLPIIITAVISLVAGYFLLPEKHIIFNVNETLIAFPFCVFGYYFKTYFMKIKTKILNIAGLVSTVFFALTPIVYNKLSGRFSYINMNENFYENFALDMFIAFCGIMGIFVFARYIKTPKFVVWFGQNTMFYYAFHIPMCTFVILIFNAVSSGLFTLQYLKGHIAVYLLITVLSLVILAPLCNLVNKYIPFIVGIKKQKK